MSFGSMMMAGSGRVLIVARAAGTTRRADRCVPRGLLLHA
jgi:hypothetical protein